MSACRCRAHHHVDRRPGFPRTSSPGELQRPKCGARSAAPRQRRASSDARMRRPSSGSGKHSTNGAREATHKQRHPRSSQRQRPIGGTRSTTPDQRRPLTIARSAAHEQLRSSAIRTARNKRRAASEGRRSRSAGTADPEARKGGHWGRTSGGRREREPTSEEGGRGHARASGRKGLTSASRPDDARKQYTGARMSAQFRWADGHEGARRHACEPKAHVPGLALHRNRTATETSHDHPRRVDPRRTRQPRQPRQSTANTPRGRRA